MTLQDSGEMLVTNFKVQLEIEAEASRVEVGRSDQAPHPVHEEELGMNERWRLVENPDAAFKEFPEVGPGSPVDVGQVIFPGKDYGDGNAAHGRGGKRRDHGPVGYEVGGHYPNLAP